jgi:hypothetical protein
VPIDDDCIQPTMRHGIDREFKLVAGLSLNRKGAQDLTHHRDDATVVAEQKAVQRNLIIHNSLTVARAQPKHAGSLNQSKYSGMAVNERVYLVIAIGPVYECWTISDFWPLL